MNCNSCGQCINPHDTIRRFLGSLSMEFLVGLSRLARTEIERRQEAQDAIIEQAQQRLRDLRREFFDALENERRRDDALNEDTAGLSGVIR